MGVLVPHGSFILPGWIRQLNKDGCAVLVLSCIFLALFFPVLFEGKTFFFRDMLHFGYPFKHFIWKSLQEGALPFWSSQISGGIPFFSLYHPGVFYPPNLIFLVKDFGEAFNYFYLFHHVVLAFSVYRLSRFWGLSSEASLGSAVVALLGGYFLSLASVYNHFQTAVWFPLVLLSFNSFLLEKKFADFLLTILFFSIAILGGSSETCIMITGLLWGYAVFVILDNSMSISLFSRTGMLAGIVFFSLGLSAAQLVPTGALVNESVRSAGVSYEQNSAMSLSPSALSMIVLPENNFGFMDTTKTSKQYFLQSCFMGLVPLGLMLAGLFSGVKNRAFWFWTVLFFGGIFFALGRFNPFYSWVYDWVPMLSFFRFPEKFFFLSAFSLVFLVGIGLDAVGADSDKKGIRRVPSLIAVLALLILLVCIAAAEPDREWITGLVTLLILAMLFAMASTTTRGVMAFRVLAVSLLILELWVRNVALLPMVDRSFYEKSPELIAKLEGSQDFYRVYGGRLLDDEKLPTANQFPRRESLMASHLALKNLLRPNLGMIYGLSYADGLTGLELKNGWLWTEIFIRSPSDKRIRMLERSNVKYWVTDEGRDLTSMGLKPVEVFEATLPRAFLVGRSQRGREPHLLNTYYSDSFDPLQEVLLGEEATTQTRDDFSGQVTNITYSPNKVELLTEQNGEGFLVLLDTYFPGWKVEVDGKPEQIFRANYFYRGVKLAPGSHRIEFSYEPVGLRMGATISGVTSILLALLFFKRKRLAAPSSTRDLCISIAKRDKL